VPFHRLLLAAALVAGACRGGDDAPPCSAVAGNFILIAQQELARVPTLDPGTRHTVQDQLPAMRDALDRSCSEKSWSAAVRTCLAKALDHVAFQACESQLTDEQRRALIGRNPRRQCRALKPPAQQLW